MKTKYFLVEWPESQKWIGHPDCYLAAGGCFIDEHLRKYHIKVKRDNVWEEIGNEHRIPAWSLHRLIEMMPQYLYITRDKEEFYLDINNDGVMYDGVAMKLALVEFVECGNLYDNIIGCIAYLIKEGYFNKEYLV